MTFFEKFLQPGDLVWNDRFGAGDGVGFQFGAYGTASRQGGGIDVPAVGYGEVEYESYGIGGNLFHAVFRNYRFGTDAERGSKKYGENAGQ